MRYLVSCTCGHTVERHDSEGCGGYGDRCWCGKDAAGALEAAVEHARLNPWEGQTPSPKPAAEPSHSIA
ncbi:MAG: hypothetical protein JWO66_1173 [Candidatus Eremiobacteraeota bacterium]|jgi:hypothetical protein|nr:hypothetical protein [Candidatus Eremiobacteraeota bacterium]